MDKIELANKIMELEGLSNDEKSALIKLLRSHKKYGLVWEDKIEDVEERLREEIPVLTEMRQVWRKVLINSNWLHITRTMNLQ